MAKVKQLTVSLENRPGTLAHMAKVLADAKVNVTALLNSTSGTQGYDADRLIAGRLDTVQWLQKYAIPYLFVTNTTSKSRTVWLTNSCHLAFK